MFIMLPFSAPACLHFAFRDGPSTIADLSLTDRLIRLTSTGTALRPRWQTSHTSRVITTSSNCVSRSRDRRLPPRRYVRRLSSIRRDSIDKQYRQRLRDARFPHPRPAEHSHLGPQ